MAYVFLTTSDDVKHEDYEQCFKSIINKLCNDETIDVMPLDSCISDQMQNPGLLAIYLGSEK